jgi:RNA polymerase sigma-70 factor (ECF subfamily)
MPSARNVRDAEVTLVGQEETRRLVIRAQGGDHAAFDALVVRYTPRLAPIIDKRLGGKLRGHVSVDDVCQETFMRAFRALDRFTWQGDNSARSFHHWLCGIAVRVILEIANSRVREKPIAVTFDLPSQTVSPGRTLARKERLERFSSALESLSPDYRTVLTLVRIKGLSVSETAQRMNRTPNAVSLLLSRALRKLRESFGNTESMSLPTPVPSEDDEP